MRPLDIITMPLLGHSLIEASAGTGKTYTISHLFLRLLINPQPGLRDRALKIDEILVVTFTDAATEDLRDRVRKNLLAALDYLQIQQADDAVLIHLLDDACEQQDREKVVLLIKQAVFALDEAAIFTIHGFCKRMLSDYSFYTGLSMEQTLVKNNQEVLQSLAQELWREHFYAMPKQQAQLIRSLWASPEALKKYYANYLCDEVKIIDSDIDDLFEQFSAVFSQFASQWPPNKQTILAEFAKGKVNGAYNKAYIKTKAAALDDFIDDETQAFTRLESNSVDAMRQSIMDEKNHNFENKVAHPIFDLLDQLNELKQCIIDHFFNAMHRYYSDQLAVLQKDQAILFFDDLIDRLQGALSCGNDESGILASILRERFPAALIDEFQDTDIKQYSIFSQIYKQSEACCLLMIGDPKQAIYSFRNADIHTYFKAKSAVDELKQYTLATNWRSSPSLVSSINYLFMQVNNPFVEDNFSQFLALNSPDTFKGRTGLQLTQTDSYALSVLSLDEDGGVNAIRDQAARKTAQLIQHVLGSKRQLNGSVVQPKDIAILVRSSAEGQMMQGVLSEYGINSIFLSKETILQSPEMTSLLRLLKSILEPFNTEYIFTALSLDFIGFDAQRLQKIKTDSEAFYTQQRYFIDALDLWQQKGFVAMWQFINQCFDIDTLLLAKVYGDRQFTNLQQLIEIFQQQTQRFSKPMQQYLHFKQWLVLAGDDEQKMRLESEDDLVQIVTMHSSKGLEYGMVCCPFLSSAGQSIKGDIHRVFNSQQQAKELHWKINSQHKAQLERELFSESIRLLYVALTRAKYHLNICWGQVKNVDKSGFWHLLYGQSKKLKSMEVNDFWLPIDSLPYVIRDPDVGDVFPSSQGADIKLLPARVISRNLQQAYVARSYSTLLSQLNALDLNPSQDMEYKVWNEHDNKSLTAPVNDTPEFTETIFHFPKGADAGNFMHLLLENIRFNDDLNSIAIEAKIQLERFGFDAKVWAQPMAEAMHKILHVDLQPQSICLADMLDASLLKEMGFSLRASSTPGSVFSALLSRYRGGRAVERFNDIDGMFTGFIDLLFEHQGQYYVLDYKSNFLGFTADDYSYEAMHEAIEEHCYDLQYLIYLAALQRFLKTRIKNYSYEQHIGGVYYLFLRGMAQGQSNGIYYTRPERKMVDEIERLFLPANLQLPEMLSINSEE